MGGLRPGEGVDEAEKRTAARGQPWTQVRSRLYSILLVLTASYGCSYPSSSDVRKEEDSVRVLRGLRPRHPSVSRIGLRVVLSLIGSVSERTNEGLGGLVKELRR